MNMRNLTEKSTLALQTAQKIAKEYGNAEVTGVHLLHAILSDKEGLIGRLLQKMGVNADTVRLSAQKEIEKFPKVRGGDQFMSKALTSVFEEAEARANALRDEYVSVEHLFLGLLEKGEPTAKKMPRVPPTSKNQLIQWETSVLTPGA